MTKAERTSRGPEYVSGNLNIFAFPDSAESSGLNLPAVRLLFSNFKPRTTESNFSKIGDTKIKKGPLTKPWVKDKLLTTRPDIIFLIDPFNGGRCPNFMSQVLRREDGQTVPAIIGILPEKPEHIVEISNRLRWIIPFPPDKKPGHLFTVVEDLEGMIVPSEVSKEAWKKIYPEKKYLVIAEGEGNVETLFSNFMNEILRAHGKPQEKEWEVRQKKGFVLRTTGVIFDRLRSRV